MSDAISEFQRAASARDLRALIKTLSPEVRVVSPLVRGAVFTGRRDVGILFRAVYGHVLSDVVWRERYDVGDVHSVTSTGRALGVRIEDLALMNTGDDGLITMIRPSLRPWNGLTAFSIALAPHLARNIPAMRRATGGAGDVLAD